jgi:hypothetical protein
MRFDVHAGALGCGPPDAAADAAAAASSVYDGSRASLAGSVGVPIAGVFCALTKADCSDRTADGAVRRSLRATAHMTMITAKPASANASRTSGPSCSIASFPQDRALRDALILIV